MKSFSIILLILLAASGCGRKDPQVGLPGGYKVWITNASEVYLSKSDDELIIGPSLRNIGYTSDHIVAWCDEPDKAYAGSVRTVGYNVIALNNGDLSTNLTEERAREELESQGSEFPAMKGIEAYSVAD